jgi:arabinofuranosyltransferase
VILAERTPRKSRLLAVILLAAAWLWLQTAWLSDDAYITFRALDHACRGLGLSWNPGERVQSFTHPLWALLLLPVQCAAGEAYFSTLAVQFVLFLASFYLLLTLAARRSLPTALGAGLAALASRALVEYGSSGLENPLLDVLLLALLHERLRQSERVRPLAGLLAALAILTRQDAALLALPLLWGRKFAPRTWLALLLPLLAWHSFALVYYGTPWPTTAYAKLNVHIPRAALASQGLAYLQRTLTQDLPTLALVALGLLLPWQMEPTPERPWLRAGSLGLALHLVYILSIGGDFMAGRFLHTPALLGLGLAVLAGPPQFVPHLPRWAMPAGVAFLLLFSAVQPHSHLLAGRDFGSELQARPMDAVDAFGIADERAYYYPLTGLLPVLAQYQQLTTAGLPIPPARGARKGLELRQSGVAFAQVNEAGFLGYFARDAHLLDVWALSDPLLARLPFTDKAWRIGHFRRAIPAGYAESLQARLAGDTAANLLRDPEQAALYADVRLLTTGPLFTAERWQAIVRQLF